MFAGARSHDAASARRILVVAILAAACLIPVSSPRARGNRAERLRAREAAQKGEYDTPTRYWREGPVRYLLTKEEDSAFRETRTEEERTRFIQRFWATRDPLPSTPENEYRTLFYRRVQEAQRLFTETTKPGWKTDRGKLYILLGPPDDIDERGDRSRQAHAIFWTYRDPPAGTSIAANSIIRFWRDRSGEYKLSTRLRLFGSETTLAIGLQVQAMQVKSLPEQRRLLDAIVSAPAPPDPSPFRGHGDFYSSGDGRTLAVLTLGVREDLLQLDGASPTPAPGVPPAPEPAILAEGRERLEVIARLVAERPDGAIYDLAGDSALRPAADDRSRDPGGYILFQGASFVEPGAYTAYFGLVDRSTGEIHSYREAVEVPTFRDDVLTIGPISLASRVDRLPEPAGLRYSAPFVLGDLRALPRIDDVYHVGEDFAFYFNVSGAATDPIGGHLDLDLEYRFSTIGGMDADGNPIFRPFGNPIHLIHQQSTIQGFSMSLDGWAPSTYRLQVEVIDNLRGQRSSGDVTFRVL